MSGWIKISRDITNHWIWQDNDYLKWWLDLILLANWEDRKSLVSGVLTTIKRGQMVASIDYLCDRWAKRDKRGKIIEKPSTKRVLKFLRLLEQDYMIKRDFGNYHNPMISVCNYAIYQDRGNDSGNDSGNETEEYKEKKEYKERKEFYCDDIARVREEIFTENENSQIWVEDMCMRFHITPDVFKQYFDEFRQECKCKETYHDSATDQRKHFHDWLRIQIEKGTKQQKAEERQKSNSYLEQAKEYERRTGLTPDAKLKIIYKDQ